MKIWLNRAPIDWDGINECGDCPMAPSMSSGITLPLSEGDVAQVSRSTLKHTTPLYVQECGNGRWLVCNPVGSGRVAVLDAEAMALFQVFQKLTPVSQVTRQRGLSEDVEEAITLFYKLGFLQSVNAPFPMPVQEQFDRLTVWLHITNACNLHCHYCYLHKTPEHMADDIAHRAVDAIFRSAMKHHMKNILLKYAGGEASLHIKNVIALHDYTAQLSQRYGIPLEAALLSNGVALSQCSIDHLKARHIALTISLDGLDSYHDTQRPLINGGGSFQYVKRTIDQLLANAVVPHIAITVSRRNLGGLPALMRYVLEHDMPFTLSYYRDNECSMHLSNLRFEEEQMIAAMQAVFAVIEQQLPRRSLLGCLIDRADMRAMHHHTCSVGHSYLVIDQHGGVAKCQADIKRLITTIDADDPLQIIRDDRQGIQGLSVEEKEGCRTCDWRYWCTGGCPLLTYRATGRYDVKSPNCNIYKALFPEVLRLEAQRLLRYEAPVMWGEYMNINVTV